MIRMGLRRDARPNDTRHLSLLSYACRVATLSLLLTICLASWSITIQAQTKRLVVIKCDGLPYGFVDRFVKERDPRTGKSVLPWFDYIFYQNGAHLSNFYVRGMSLSAPSWSLLDTGQHLQIKGNVEFDRYTLHSYDYLNFFPFFLGGALGDRIDMPAVEVLDSLGVPLFADAFPHDEKYTTFSSYQRGLRYRTFQDGLQNRFKKAPKELFDEWTMGFGIRSAVTDQLLAELLEKLSNPKIRYLELFLADFDHVGHHNNDVESQLFVLKQMDAIVGQIWTAVQKTPEAANTTVALVSDHGFNSDPKLYSQGFNLVKLLGSKPGGGHHVVTKRRLLLDYAIKGINPLVPLITTTTSDTYYLKGQSTDYPTALLDFDGNERASIHLRDSDLNLLQILLQELQRSDLKGDVREAAAKTFFDTIDHRRDEWTTTLRELQDELEALNTKIEGLQKRWAAQPKKFSKEDQDAGRDDDTKRLYVQLNHTQKDALEYRAYASSLHALLALRPENFSPSKLKISDLIPPRAMGEQNSIHELQHYIVGLGQDGLVVGANGMLDPERTFVHIDYFSLLHGITVKNNVQPGIGNRPIDLAATRISTSLVKPYLKDENLSDDTVWISDGSGGEALLLSRVNAKGQISIRYQPISHLTQDENGRVEFKLENWRAGLPLKLFEDPALKTAGADRVTWLSAWHSDVEWLQAIHETQYSNGLIGLHEELARHWPDSVSVSDANLPESDRLNRRFVQRKRKLVEADILVVANNHWNFDVRGFNPGGNHGSFFRISTHSTLMVAGGKNTRVPAGITIDEPYDSLSFVPTLLALIGELRDDTRPIPVLWERGFSRFPGRVVKELLPNRPDAQSTVDTGASASP